MQDRLKLAGLLAITNAILLYPLTDMARTLSGSSSTSAIMLFALVSGIGFFLFVYVISTLKILLEKRFEYDGASLAFNFLIGLYAAHFGANLLLTFVGEAHIVLERISLALMAATGVAYIIVGWQLRSVPEYLYDLGKVLPYLMMLMGACIASVVFISTGVVVGVFVYLLLAVILSRAARDYEQQQT